MWGRTLISPLLTQYRERGLQAIQDQPRSGRSLVIDGQQRAKITSLTCSEPPEGYAQWSLPLLADKAIELGYVEGISHTEVRKILKKTNYNRISNAPGV